MIFRKSFEEAKIAMEKSKKANKAADQTEFLNKTKACLQITPLFCSGEGLKWTVSGQWVVKDHILWPRTIHPLEKGIVIWIVYIPRKFRKI